MRLRLIAVGAVMYWSMQSLVLDCWGMEGTIRRIVRNWSPASQTVPIALFFLVVAIFSAMPRKRKRVPRMDDRTVRLVVGRLVGGDFEGVRRAIRNHEAGNEE